MYVQGLTLCLILDKAKPLQLSSRVDESRFTPQHFLEAARNLTLAFWHTHEVTARAPIILAPDTAFEDGQRNVISFEQGYEE